MSFAVIWTTLLEELDELPDDALFVTARSSKPFRITDVQEYRVIIRFERDDAQRPLQRDQFETLYRRLTDRW